MSGGRATVAARKGVKLASQAGDISAVDPEGANLIALYFVECKFYKTIDLESWVYSGKGHLANWWHIAKSAAKAINKNPLLIAKGNQRPALVLVEHAEGLVNGALPVAHLVDAEGIPVNVYLLDTLLAHAPASMIRAVRSPELYYCPSCDNPFDVELLGKYGCPHCHGEGLEGRRGRVRLNRRS